MTFEEALTRLEEIVKEMEGGTLTLEESVKRFEEGMALSHACQHMLEEAEQKVEILTAQKEGTKKITPFSLPLTDQGKERSLDEPTGENQQSQ